jgi:hypothetical protein
MAFKAYFNNSNKSIWKIASNEEINVMDNIYVNFNNAIPKSIIETEFNDLNSERKYAVLDNSNNIIWTDIEHNQFTVDTTEVDSDGVNLFTQLKNSYSKRQASDLKSIKSYLENNSNNDWSTFYTRLEDLNFQDNSIYPLVNGYAAYILAQNNIPQFSILRLP